MEKEILSDNQPWSAANCLIGTARPGQTDPHQILTNMGLVDTLQTSPIRLRAPEEELTRSPWEAARPRITYLPGDRVKESIPGMGRPQFPFRPQVQTSHYYGSESPKKPQGIAEIAPSLSILPLLVTSPALQEGGGIPGTPEPSVSCPCSGSTPGRRKWICLKSCTIQFRWRHMEIRRAIEQDEMEHDFNHTRFPSGENYGDKGGSAVEGG